MTFDDAVVAAMVYDPSDDAWHHVLPATHAPAGIQLPAMPVDQRAWLVVMTHDAETGDWTLAHGNWFGRLAAEPTEPIVTVEDDGLTGVELPVETLVVPDATDAVTVLVYCVHEGHYIDAVAGLPGGAMLEFSVPAWNRWYRLDFVDATDGTLIESQWLGHLRTHGPALTK